jgi:hypothetical protein
MSMLKSWPFHYKILLVYRKSERTDQSPVTRHSSAQYPAAGVIAQVIGGLGNSLVSSALSHNRPGVLGSHRPGFVAPELGLCHTSTETAFDGRLKPGNGIEEAITQYVMLDPAKDRL